MQKSWIALTTAAIMLMLLTTGCTKPDRGATGPPEPENPASDINPFETESPEEFMPSSVSHGPTNQSVDENDIRLPFKYEGGEFKLDYSTNASGKAKNIGFLIFLDGIPQPYKVDSATVPNEHMHIFNLAEDDRDTAFSFIFTPVTGVEGETLTLTVISVYNPSFIPDMKKTMFYGMYHSILPMELALDFKQDAEKSDSAILPRKYLTNIETHTKPITKQALEVFNNSFEMLELADLETHVYTNITLASETHPDNLKIGKNGMLHIAYEIVGIPGVKYKNVFYINHEPVGSAESSSFSTALSKGGINVIEADLNLEKLGDFSTFYIVSVPTNASDFPNDVIMVEKTSSILLYK